MGAILYERSGEGRGQQGRSYQRVGEKAPGAGSGILTAEAGRSRVFTEAQPQYKVRGNTQQHGLNAGRTEKEKSETEKGNAQKGASSFAFCGLRQREHIVL